MLHEPNLEKILNVKALDSRMFLKTLMDAPNRYSCIQISSYALLSGCDRLMPYWGFGDDDGKMPELRENIVFQIHSCLQWTS